MVTRRLGFGSGAMRPTPVVLATLILLTAIYFVVGISLRFVDAGASYVKLLPIVSSQVLDGEVWRLVTYGLLHDPSNPMHLVLNGLTLYFFGRDLEVRFGRGRFIAFLVGA